MPKFEVTTDDGKRFEIEAADHDAAAKVLSAHTGTKPGVATSLVRGAMQGASMGFADELKGLHSAGTGNETADRALSVHPIGQAVRTGVGGLRYLTGSPDASAAYDSTVQSERDLDRQAHDAHPWAYTGGEVAGAAALPFGAGGAAATLPARMALSAGVGAGAGALSGAGAGEGVADTVKKAVTGAGLGAVGGGVAPAVMKGVEAVAPAVMKAVEPTFNAVRGFKDPEAEAARRVTAALTRDVKNSDAGLSGKELDLARREGAPVSVMDMGGETTRALARSSANTSPEGRATLERTISDRFESQAPRLASWLRETFHYPNASAQQDALDQVARTINRPNYAKAYADGATMKWDETFEQISQAPVVQDAIRKAMVNAKNEAAKAGFTPPKNPFEFDKVTGRLQLKSLSDAEAKARGLALGSKMEPNLQFWDIVKRNLDKTGTPEARDWAKILRDRLDDIVPSYGTARAGAAKFFGAGDALEAGQNFVGASSRFGLPEARKALSKMSPDERQLFQDGYVSRLVETIEKTGDRRNVVNQIMNSPAAREEITVALGPQRFKELEARLRVETIMDRMRGAVTGNSSTVRQLTEAGLAGGTTSGAGYSLSTGDWSPSGFTSAAALGGLLSGVGRFAGGKVQKGIDQRVSRKVAEMLVSDDPKVLQKGIAIVAKQPKLLAALRSADDALARSSGSQLSGVSLPQLQGPAAGRAENEQQ